MKNKDGTCQAHENGRPVYFPSNAEYRQFLRLMQQEHVGLIQDLELQPKFELLVNGIKVGTYKADFRYVAYGFQVVEDVKSWGSDDPLSKLKRKLVQALYEVEIKLVG